MHIAYEVILYNIIPFLRDSTDFVKFLREFVIQGIKDSLLKKNQISIPFLKIKLDHCHILEYISKVSIDLRFDKSTEITRFMHATVYGWRQFLERFCDKKIRNLSLRIPLEFDEILWLPYNLKRFHLYSPGKINFSQSIRCSLTRFHHRMDEFDGTYETNSMHNIFGKSLEGLAISADLPSENCITIRGIFKSFEKMAYVHIYADKDIYCYDSNDIIVRKSEKNEKQNLMSLFYIEKIEGKISRFRADGDVNVHGCFSSSEIDIIKKGIQKDNKFYSWNTLII